MLLCICQTLFEFLIIYTIFLKNNKTELFFVGLDQANHYKEKVFKFKCALHQSNDRFRQKICFGMVLSYIINISLLGIMG